MILLDREVIGIISGGASAYAVKARDDFFGITKENRNVALNGIVDNTVFRLEKHLPNLATQILALWRITVERDWREKYGVIVCGFETFVIENKTRKGSLYKADNWTFVGRTQGSTKFHQHGVEKHFERREVEQKLIFCKWTKHKELPSSYNSTWHNRGQCVGQMTIFDFINEVNE